MGHAASGAASSIRRRASASHYGANLLTVADAYAFYTLNGAWQAGEAGCYAAQQDEYDRLYGDDDAR